MRLTRLLLRSCGGAFLGMCFAELMSWQRGPSLFSADGTDWPTALAIVIGAGVGCMVADTWRRE